MEYGIENYTYKKFPTVQVSQLGKISVRNSQKGLFSQDEYLKLDIQGESIDDEQAEWGGVLMRDSEEIKIEINLPKTMTAPVKNGEHVGDIVYSLNGDIYRKETVFVKENVYRIDYKYCLVNVMQRFLLSISNKKS